MPLCTPDAGRDPLADVLEIVYSRMDKIAPFLSSLSFH
jgi:hypothetical protein